MIAPRARLTRDRIWLTGCTWGSTLMGWGVLLAMFLGHKSSGTAYLPPNFFWTVTTAFVAYLWTITSSDASVSEMASPLEPIKATFFPKGTGAAAPGGPQSQATPTAAAT